MGSRSDAFRRLQEDVYYACELLQSKRQLGEIGAGPAAYAATVTEVARLMKEGDYFKEGLSIADGMGTLHDITARCVNRYA